MPYLIPDDWDGETFQCVEVHWPNSPQWWSILRGMVSEMARGRMWDEKTGSIKDTQEIGREIWARSFPFMPCGSTGCPETGDNGGTGTGGPINVGPGFWCTEMWIGEEEMINNVGENGLPVKVDGNALYYWKCCEWQLVGYISGSSTELPDEPFNPDADPEFEYSACGKAYAIVDMVYRIVDACLDQVAEYPWRWIPQIEDTVGYDLDNQWLILNVSGLIAFDLAGFGSDELFSDLEKQRIICNVLPLMSDDGAGISQDTYEQVKEVFAGEFYADILARGEFYRNAINALGWKDMSAVAQLGASQTGFDCGCPDEPFVPVWPDGMDWEYYWDLETVQSLPSELTLLDGSYLTVGEGVQHYSDVSGLGNPTLQSLITATGGTVKVAYLRYTIGAGPGEGDYEGVAVAYGTDVDGFINEADTGDTDPSQGGTFSVYKNLNYVIVGGDNRLYVKLEVRDEGSHTEDRSVKIRGIGIAGTGTDPAFGAT